MFCTKCGKSIPENTAFCISCGSKVEAASAAVSDSAETPYAGNAQQTQPEKQVNPELARRTRLLIGIGAGVLLVALAVVLLFVFVFSDMETEDVLSVAELLDLGEKYLLRLDYEQALVQFLKVIEIEPMNERGYTGAAEAYVGLGDTDSAITILEKGLEVLPGNRRVQNRIDDLQLLNIMATPSQEPTPPIPTPTPPTLDEIWRDAYAQFLYNKKPELLECIESSVSNLGGYHHLPENIREMLFILYDIDRNGIPELILINSEVFTFSNDAIVKVGDVDSFLLFSPENRLYRLNDSGEAYEGIIQLSDDWDGYAVYHITTTNGVLKKETIYSYRGELGWNNLWHTTYRDGDENRIDIPDIILLQYKYPYSYDGMLTFHDITDEEYRSYVIEGDYHQSTGRLSAAEIIKQLERY